MNNDKNKRENRKALRSFIPILLLMAVIGGIIGSFFHYRNGGFLDRIRKSHLERNNVCNISHRSDSDDAGRRSHNPDILQKGKKVLPKRA